MEKENSITFNGVKHILVESTRPEICDQCSLQKLCDLYTHDLWSVDGICIGLFAKRKHYFKVLEQE